MSTSPADIIEKAFQDLEKSVTPSDSRQFSSTTLQGVRDAALQIETELAARQTYCNLRRLDPLIAGLGHYSKVTEVLCNGNSYVPWIWAPIKLVLQLVSDYVDAFKIIIDAYSQIAECLPRFDLLSEALRDSPDFQHVLAIFYADILRFHKEAYRFMRRPSWKIFFLASWGRFQRRFKGILSDMSRHAELVEKEANAFHISEAQKWRNEMRVWRDESLADISRRDKQESFSQYKSLLSWLDVKQSEQDDIYESLLDSYCDGTCDWMSQNRTITSWMRRQPDQPYLWLKGKPGAGKSVLSTRIVKFLENEPDSLLIRHFCSHFYSSSIQYGNILTSIVHQLLRGNDDLLAYVYAEYILMRKSTSSSTLESLISTLLTAISTDPAKMFYVRIILDGVDECSEDTQQRVVKFVARLLSPVSGAVVCKLLVCSQDAGKLTKMLRSKISISLEEEKESISLAIQLYTKQRLKDIRAEFLEFNITESDIEYTEKTIAEKADGMFLWARLVLDVLASEVFDAHELRAAVDRMPRELNAFYRRIWSRIESRLEPTSLEKVRWMLSWIMFARRPLRKTELQAVLAFDPSNTAVERLVPDQITWLCKPLIEEKNDSTYRFVHSSAQDYLENIESGPVVSKIQAWYEQSLACVVYLKSATKVFGPEYPIYGRNLRIVKGLHGFHLYATHYWIDHLLAYAELEPKLTLGTSTALLGTAQHLAHILNASKSAVETSTPNPAIPISEDRVKLLEMHQPLCGVVKDELVSRQVCHVMTDGTIVEEAHSLATTTLSGILCAYQETVKELIQLNSFVGISQEDFKAFKKAHALSAYTCRFSGCVGATVGFENNRARDEHEEKHTQKLRCTVPDCGYDVPFTSSRALKSHHNKHHAIAFGSKMAGRIRREDSCRPCKIANFSCDVKKPHCERCISRNLRCEYDARTVSSMPKTIRRSKQNISALQQSATDVNQPPLGQKRLSAGNKVANNISFSAPAPNMQPTNQLSSVPLSLTHREFPTSIEGWARAFRNAGFADPFQDPLGQPIDALKFCSQISKAFERFPWELTHRPTYFSTGLLHALADLEIVSDRFSTVDGLVKALEEHVICHPVFMKPLPGQANVILVCVKTFIQKAIGRPPIPAKGIIPEHATGPPLDDLPSDIPEKIKFHLSVMGADEFKKAVEYIELLHRPDSDIPLEVQGYVDDTQVSKIILAHWGIPASYSVETWLQIKHWIYLNPFLISCSAIKKFSELQMRLLAMSMKDYRDENVDLTSRLQDEIVNSMRRREEEEEVDHPSGFVSHANQSSSSTEILTTGNPPSQQDENHGSLERSVRRHLPADFYPKIPVWVKSRLEMMSPDVFERATNHIEQLEQVPDIDKFLCSEDIRRVLAPQRLDEFFPRNLHGSLTWRDLKNLIYLNTDIITTDVVINLQQYMHSEMELMLLGQQNKKRLLMARFKEDGIITDSSSSSTLSGIPPVDPMDRSVQNLDNSPLSPELLHSNSTTKEVPTQQRYNLRLPELYHRDSSPLLDPPSASTVLEAQFIRMNQPLVTENGDM